MISKANTLLIVLLFSCYYAFSQDENDKQLKAIPYLGFNLPQGKFNDFSDNGIVLGISLDKYLSSKIALGIDVNFQSNNLNNSIDYSIIPSPYSLITDSQGNWKTTTITLGPTYKFGNQKFNTEIYVKAGLSMFKSSSYKVVFADDTFPEITLFDLKEQSVSSFGLTTGVRFNYAISDKLSVFINPQYVISSAEVEYFHRDFSEESFSNPEILAQDGGELCFIKPSFVNINAGIAFSFGPKNKGDSGENDIEEIRGDVCGVTKLKTPYMGETFFADSGVVPEFTWINHSNPIAKSYFFELYYGDRLVYEKTVKSPIFKFTEKMAEEFYDLEGIRDYRWRVTTQYDNCETTTTDFNYFTIHPSSNTATRSQCSLLIMSIDIYCSDNAYDGNGNVSYSGTITIKNNSTLPAILTSHPFSSNPSQNIGVDVMGSTLTYSQGGFSSSCPATPMMNTPNGPALAPQQSATFCFELTVPIGTSSVNFLANINVYNGGLSPSECPEQMLVELPVCSCDTCDSWDFTNETHSTVYDAANNNPYLSHMILQSFQIPGTAPIRKMKAEIVYVKHQASDPECYTCTTQVNDMGLFSAVNIKPKDILAQPLDWVNNAEGILRDSNNDSYSNMLVWNARNKNLGVDFATQRHNFQMWINLPGESNLDCCSHSYEVWIRYTFEDLNCNTCDVLIKYDLSNINPAGGGIPFGNGGVGGVVMPNGTNVNTNLRN